MAAISTFITKCRKFYKDNSKKTGDIWDGDGSNKVFRTTEVPILENSYIIYVGGVAQTETTHYSIDVNTGEITFVTAPTSGNDNVKAEYETTKQTDNQWLENIQDAVEFFGDKIFTDEIIEDVATVANQLRYDGQTGQIALIAIWARMASSSSASDYQDLRAGFNISYYKESNEINISPPFTDTSFELKYRYLKRITRPTATTDDIDWANNFTRLYLLKAGQFHYENLANEKALETGVVTKERTFHPATTLLRIADYYEKAAEKELKRVRPRRPSTVIPNIVVGQQV